jgi:hypothetical protein
MSRYHPQNSWYIVKAHCLRSLLILLESLHTNVFHTLQSDLPSTARPHISTVSKEFTVAAINLLSWEFIYWIS